MPLVADQFAGHLLKDDPRDLFTGTYRVQWPTIPAYRYRIQSDDATGMWAVWNNGGVLVEFRASNPDGKISTWFKISGNPLIEFVNWRKTYDVTNETDWLWQLVWKRTDDPLVIIDLLFGQTGKVNVTVPLPDWDAGPSFPGSFGLTARADQVVWDRTAPPE